MTFLLANGFLPTRGSFVLDFVFVAMFAICLTMLASIWLVRYRRLYRLHRNLQITLAVILAVAIVIFEIDIRFVTDWRALAAESRFYQSGLVNTVLWIHLVFAIPTPFVWGYVVYQAVKKFPPTVAPSTHSSSHRFWGRIAAVMMLLTAATGCVFYWLAFAM